MRSWIRCGISSAVINFFFKLNDNNMSDNINTPKMSDVVEEADEQVLPEAPPVVMDDAAFDEQEREREEAFNSEPMWAGKLLQPFSISRSSYFYQQRFAVGAPPLESLLLDENTFLADAVRILFLCVHDPQHYRHLRSKPAEMQELVEAWADENINTPALEIKAVTVALELFNAASANEAVSAPSGDPTAEADLGN